MSRSSRRLRKRHSGWRRTAAEAASRRIEGPTPAPPRTVVASGSSRLSDGLVIETSVLARLLGVKLLTLEGTVLVSPAQLLREGSALATPAAVPVAVARREESVRRLDRGSASRSAASGEAVGTRLGSAARLLRESSRDLCSIEPGS